MTRVGFIVLTSNSWVGGSNYYKNLLFAVSRVKEKNIQPVLFLSSKAERGVIDQFAPYGQIVKTSLLNNKSPDGFLNSLFIRLFNRSFLMHRLFRREHIDVVSHSRFLTSDKHIKTINWIVDFQHIHYPDMFSFIERLYRNILFSMFAKYSNAVVLSSNDARKDFVRQYPKYAHKAKVLQFVAQVNQNVYKVKEIQRLERKYAFKGKYFFLPNQLWKHKNHIVVLEAVKLLKKQNKNVLVLCTGGMKDYRNISYSKELLEYMKDNNLEDSIKFLGLVNYEEVQQLMKFSISVINPSLFEGWSTTVEEAKSIGKGVILSNIGVHKEQDPPDSIFFNPNDSKELAEILWKKWKSDVMGPKYNLESRAKAELDDRMREFGKKYQDIVIQL